MSKADVLDILRSRQLSNLEFHFENLNIPPMWYYLSNQDVEELRKIATSIKLASKINVKYSMIDEIMKRRGFKRFSAGTNRVVYRYLEDDRFLVKIAVDKVGMQDNPLEFKNQFLLQPYVSKMFYISECGTVGFCERVLPIKNKYEFKEIASDVFDILVYKILGLYVVEDVGTKYFMNWGIRPGFGPVLLDYPYVYKLDGNKLFCNWKDQATGIACDGEIDYDEGFNHLVCSKCGKVYMATDLRDNNEDNKIVIKKGGFKMKVVIKKGDTVIGKPVASDDVMVKPKKEVKSTGLKVRICKGGTPINEEPKIVSVNTEPKIEVPKCWVEDSKEEKKDVKVSEEDEPVNVASTFIPTPDDVEQVDNDDQDDEEEAPKYNYSDGNIISIHDNINQEESDDEDDSDEEESEEEEDENASDAGTDEVGNHYRSPNSYGSDDHVDSKYEDGYNKNRSHKNKKKKNKHKKHNVIPMDSEY